MKKVLLIVLAALIFAGCGTDPATLPQKEPGLIRDIDTGKAYKFEEGDFNHEIQYESGSFKVSKIAFSETKENAYYTEMASAMLDFSNLNEDERQWFIDGYGGLLDDISSSMYSYFDEEYKSMFLYDAKLIEHEGNPYFVIIFYMKDVKHSIEGSSYSFKLQIKQKDKKTNEYQFDGTVKLNDES